MLIAFVFVFTGCGAEPSSVAEASSEAVSIAAENVETSETESTNRQRDTSVEPKEQRMIYVTVGEHVITAKLEDNSSSKALMEKLSEGDITVEMHDYSNFEKVGPLGFDLPRNDESIVTKPGDIILYQGNQLVFYYDTNSWNFTKLGEFQGVTGAELIEIFGSGNITAVLSPEK